MTAGRSIREIQPELIKIKKRFCYRKRRSGNININAGKALVSKREGSRRCDRVSSYFCFLTGNIKVCRKTNVWFHAGINKSANQELDANIRTSMRLDDEKILFTSMCLERMDMFTQKLCHIFNAVMNERFKRCRITAKQLLYFGVFPLFFNQVFVNSKDVQQEIIDTPWQSIC